MTFELEYEAAGKQLKKIFRQYGCCIFENPSKFHAYWGDLAPGLTEEGKALDEFLALGLGQSVVELDEDRDSCVEWQQDAVKRLSDNGMEQDDAVLLVKMVLRALGLDTEPETNAKELVEVNTEESVEVNTEESVEVNTEESVEVNIEESVETNTKAVDTIKSAADMNAFIKAAISIPEPDEIEKSRRELCNVLKQVANKKQSSGNSVENSCELLREYLPKLCPNCNFVSPTPLPAGIKDGLKPRVGAKKLYKTNFLAYGAEISRHSFLLFTKSSLTYKISPDVFREIIYSNIQKISIVDGEIWILYKNNSKPEKISWNWEDENLSISQLLCSLAGIEKPEVVVTNKSVFIQNVLQIYGIRAVIINDKQSALKSKKMKNVFASLSKAGIFISIDDINAVIDETVFGSCKNYIVFTNTEILAHYDSNEIKRAKYSAIVSVWQSSRLDICLSMGSAGEIIITHLTGNGKTEMLCKAISCIVSANI